MGKRGGWPEAPSEILQDRIHVVDVDLLDRLTKHEREVPDGLVFPFDDGLEGADVPLLPDRAQILRDERGPQFAKYVYWSPREFVKPSQSRALVAGWKHLT